MALGQVLYKDLISSKCAVRGTCLCFFPGTLCPMRRTDRLGFENRKTILALQFGLIHGLIGLPDELVAGNAVLL